MLRRLAPGEHEYDLCIIGAGPAGLTVAAELAYSGLRVCVLESGEEKRGPFADALKEVLNEGLAIKPESRVRALGGASLTWNGRSARLDPIDFESRPWSPGWPFGREVLEPLEVRAGAYRFPAVDEFLRSEGPEGEPRGWRHLQEKVFVMTLPTYRYGSLKYLFDRAGFDLAMGATVVRLEVESGRVVSAVCRSEGGAESRVRARAFVLAAGGIENPRLLLNSNLGNEHDQVGRYFMNHTKCHSGYWCLSRRLPLRSLYTPQTEGPRMNYLGLRLTEEFQRAHGLLNSYVGFEPRLGFVQRVACALGRRILPPSTDLLRSMSRPRTVRLSWHIDMEPQAENRVVLGEKRDAFGMPMASVRHRLSSRDMDTIRALWKELGDDVGRNGLGHLSGSPEEVIADLTIDASHHLGATRMGRDPVTSVVNTDCRLHTVENLFVAGSSVFPTAGCANPTMTIVALALRLADHLGELLGARRAETAAPGGRKRIVIIGAGRRVSEDVVPALESLGDAFEITGLYARSPGAVFGRRRRYDVRPLQESTANLKEADFVYLAVPRGAVVKALKNLAPTPRAELVIDTPTPLSRDFLQALRRFRKVHVAEDSACLPWLDAVRAWYGKKSQAGPREIDCDRSVFRYHGIALLKVLAGTPGAPARVRSGRRRGRVLRLRVGDARARIVQDRDYAKGKLTLDGSEIRLLCAGESCTGFEIEGTQSSLTPDESILMGGVLPGDTVVTRMLHLKRVGLARMLAMAARGEDPWPLAEGINDARVDHMLQRFRIFLRLGTSR
ncbi:MAG: GMC oxidoreductase [Planctomycetota bacterium]